MPVPIGVVPPIGTAITSPVTAPMYPGAAPPSVAGALPGVQAPPQPVLEENKGLWKNFIQKMRTDPNFKMAMMQTGLGMMRSAKMGENAFDVAGSAIGAGAQTLDALRQRDLAANVAAGEREQKAYQTNKELEYQGRQVGAAEEQVDIARKGLEQRGESEKNQLKIEEDKLQALKDRNADQHEIELQEARTNRIRAEAYAKFGGEGGAGGGMSSQESMIENLTAQKVASGTNETQARAEATREVMTSSRGSSLLSSVDNIVKLKTENYMFSPESKTNPLTTQMIDEFRRQAYDQVRKEANAYSGVPDQTPLKPQAQAFVARQRAKGVPEGDIAAHLIKNGDDPLRYGVEVTNAPAVP